MQTTTWASNFLWNGHELLRSGHQVEYKGVVGTVARWAHIVDPPAMIVRFVKEDVPDDWKIYREANGYAEIVLWPELVTRIPSVRAPKDMYA